MVDEALGVDGKSNAAGAVYRDEAADLVAAAARGEQLAEAGPFMRRPKAPPVRPEQPLSYGPPVGLNDNTYDDVPSREVRQFSVARLVAWIVIAPWYLLVAAGSIGIDFLFARTLLGF